MRIVVTGGAGFIGSHFIEKIVNEGMEAVVVDNLITGSVDNIKEYIDKGTVKFIQQDVQEFIDIEGEVDVVMHLASIASPKAYVKYPVNTLKSGSLGTINSLGLAKVKKAKYVLALSLIHI